MGPACTWQPASIVHHTQLSSAICNINKASRSLRYTKCLRVLCIRCSVVPKCVLALCRYAVPHALLLITGIIGSQPQLHPKLVLVRAFQYSYSCCTSTYRTPVPVPLCHPGVVQGAGGRPRALTSYPEIFQPVEFFRESKNSPRLVFLYGLKPL